MKIIIGILVLYSVRCLYLSYQAACIGVHPDGASFVCGHLEYRILFILLAPISLLFFFALPAASIHEVLENAGLHGDLLMSVIMTFLNSLFWLGIFIMCRRLYARKKCMLERNAETKKSDA